MAKHATGTKRTRERATADSPAATDETVEEYMVAFAEQLGRVAATVQTRAEGWMDRERLSRQISSVRDNAAALLNRFAVGKAKSAKGTDLRASRRGRNKGRSGGVVDAPGKKHRGPTPVDPRVKRADSHPSGPPTAKVRKANRRGGRG
jgi:hypothetical protein